MTETKTDSSKSKSSRNRKRLILIDGYGLIFRAFHAVPPNLSNAKGELTNATFGFTSMVLEVLRRDTPDYIVMAFDVGRTFRHEEFTEYKANRSETPAELTGQLGRIREVVESLGITICEAEGFEADDVIGTLARQGVDENLEVMIITGDNDLLQLVNEHTTAVLPGAGPKARFSDARYFNTEKVVEKYGFGPDFVADYKAIVGDKSDNIPNIPSLGEVTAKKLIAEYGHIEQIIENIPNIKPPKVQTQLENFKEQAIKSKRLATIVTDVPVQLDLEAARAHQVNQDKVIELFRELEFKSLIAKLPGAHLPGLNPALATSKTPAAPDNGQMSMFDEPLAAEADPWEVPADLVPPKLGQYHLIRTEDGLAALVERVKETGRMAFDTETDSLNFMQAKLVGLAIAPAPEEGYYVPVGHLDGNKKRLSDQLEWETVRTAFAPLFADPKMELIAHNAKFDFEILHRHGIELSTTHLNFDTMVASQMLGNAAVGLKDLALVELNLQMTHIEELIGRGKTQVSMDVIAPDKAGPYAAADADITLRLADRYKPELEDKGLWKLFTEIEMPLTQVLTTMELCGVAINTDRLGEISGTLGSEIKALEDQIYTMSGHPFNPNSPDQLGKVLFEELGLKGGKKTATKKFSTDKKTLDYLRGEHPIVNLVLEYRQLVKLKSTYVDSLPTLIDAPTGRIHTSFNQIGASSGRVSSSEPNLQNIPIRTEVGREVRKAFVADNKSSHRLFGDEKSVLLTADYSQIELRLLAHLTEDEKLVTAFLADKDIHRATAADVFGVPEDEVTAEQRRVAKTVNFGIIYGLSAFGLTQQISISFKDASDFIKAYYERYPKVKAYLDKTPDQARQLGYVQTLFGRRRYMADIHSHIASVRGEAERAASNMPVQGTAADIVKIAMRHIYDEMLKQKLRSKLLLQVHDELVFEVPESELKPLGQMVKANMERVGVDMGLKVPLKADLKTGQNWGDIEELHL